MTELTDLIGTRFPNAHPGIELIERFVALGEYGVGDVVEAWRACCVTLAAFYEVTPGDFLRSELAAGHGLEDVPPVHVVEHARKKLVAHESAPLA